MNYLGGNRFSCSLGRVLMNSYSLIQQAAVMHRWGEEEEKLSTALSPLFTTEPSVYGRVVVHRKAKRVESEEG